LSPECRTNDGEYAVDISQHLVIPQSQNTITARLEPHGSSDIRRDVACMLTAVDLDDEPFCQTDEIDDIPSDRRLPSKPVSIALPVAKARP